MHRLSSSPEVTRDTFSYFVALRFVVHFPFSEQTGIASSAMVLAMEPIGPVLILLGLVNIGIGMYIGRREPLRTMIRARHPGLPLIVVGIMTVLIGGALARN